MTVDRPHRDQLLDAMGRYLDDQLSAFEFDEEIFKIHDATQDPTVRSVVHILWLFYDDCDDHHVVLSREAWDYIQRLRLVLASDSGLETVRQRHWTFTQMAAALALASFLWEAIEWGWGKQLLIVAIPFGFTSIALSMRRQRILVGLERDDPRLTPFASLGQLLRVRRSTPTFRKHRYLPNLALRQIDRPFGVAANYVHLYAVWLLMAPVALFFQAWPLSTTHHKLMVDAE